MLCSVCADSLCVDVTERVCFVSRLLELRPDAITATDNEGKGLSEGVSE
mgnify:CR=1 FL=1